MTDLERERLRRLSRIEQLDAAIEAGTNRTAELDAALVAAYAELYRSYRRAAVNFGNNAVVAAMSSVVAAAVAAFSPVVFAVLVGVIPAALWFRLGRWTVSYRVRIGRWPWDTRPEQGAAR